MADQTPSGSKLQNTIDVRNKRSQVLARYSEFKDAARLRRERLEGARQFQQFRRDADELEAWINEKIQIVSDESYKDRTNLQVLTLIVERVEVGSAKGVGLSFKHKHIPLLLCPQAKTQKHQAFEAETAAHSNAILTLKSTGRTMIDQKHFAAEQIQVGPPPFAHLLHS